MNIYSFDIDVNEMPPARTARRFTITGDKNAEFEIFAVKADSLDFYNFESKSFSAGHNSLNNNLKVKIRSTTYTGEIIFPSGGGDYVIKLLAVGDTQIANSNSNIITKSISKQATTATLTFQPGSDDTSFYQTLPTATSTGSINDTAVVAFDVDVLNSTTDAKSFGFSLTDRTTTSYNSEFWYYETTEAVVTNGSGTDGADTLTVTVADTSEIVVGMQLKYYKSTTAPELNNGSSAGSIRVSGVDASTGVITFNSEVGFDEGQTMTFRAYGIDVIQSAIDINLTISDVNVTPEALVKAVEARGGVTEATDGSASLNIALPDTHGIGGGRFFGYVGAGVNNSAANEVNVVTPDGDGSGNDGLITVTLAQELTAGTLLTFKSTHKKINLTSSITINKYPTANKTIFFDLDKILTVGVNGL